MADFPGTSCAIDHLVITAPTLALGAAFIHQALGIAPQPGGEHPRMGTHNLLLRLGERMYLEIIAINPAARESPRARWFGLDRLAADAPARLATWVVNTTDIHATVDACSEELGVIEPMSRGHRNWQITIPADGLPPLGGVAPALIEWATPEHPAAMLDEHGLSLLSLALFHPEPQRVQRLLDSLGMHAPLTVTAAPAQTAPHLIARIGTPSGERTLTF